MGLLLAQDCGPGRQIHLLGQANRLANGPRFSPDDYLVGVNCFMLSKQLAVNLSPICHRKFRQPGVLEIDRMLVRVLRQNAPRFESSYLYSMNYRVGSTPLQASFFLDGNRRMEERFQGQLPWSLKPSAVESRRL